MLDCRHCPPDQQRRLGCPDLGPDAAPQVPFRVGAGPMSAHGVPGDVTFPQCGRWWLREPGRWPDGRAYGFGFQTAYQHVAMLRYELKEFGGPPMYALPGRLRACLLALAEREAIKSNRAIEAAKADAKEKGRGP